MLKEQKYVLKQACELVEQKGIEAVLIAGDVFDKPIPSLGALEVFEEFLNNLNKKRTKVFIISGNHDNMDRLSYLSNLLSNNGIYISRAYNGEIEKIELNKDIVVYLMPYLYPGLVKKYFQNENIKNYNDAIETVLNNTEIDKNKFNIILSHQFVIGKNEVILSNSEQKSVGGIDEVNYKIFEKFDYCALGHLHCPQKCGVDKIRYAGSILKYSFSEINQKKNFVVLDIVDKKLNLEFYPINFIHEMKEYIGYIDEFLNKDFYQNIDTDDYIKFILKDECVLDAKKKLSLIYPNIMQLEFDNEFTRSLKTAICANNLKDKSIYEHFCNFYENQINLELDKEKNNIVQNILNEDVVCDQ